MMKTALLTPLVVAGVLTLAGCSSTRTEINTGPIPARTFSFVQTEGRTAPVFADTRQEVHALVQSSITEALARRQVTRAAQGGDVTVAYLLIKGNNAVTTSINDYFGYNRDGAKLAEEAHTRYTNQKNPNYFEAGTLLIDIIDSRSWKVLKRAHASSVLTPNLTPEARATRINQAVEQILADVQFKQ